MKRRNFLATAAAGAIIATWPLQGAWAETPDDMLVVGFSMANVLTLDPASAGGKERVQIITNIYDGLVAIDPENRSELVPELAERWEVIDEGRAIRFHLRPDAVFGSGNPVTAEDVVWTFTRCLELNLAQATNFTLRGYTAENAAENFIAVDEHTVEVRIPTETDPKIILMTLAMTGPGSILDRTEVMAHEQDGDMGQAWLANNAAGSGAFLLTMMRPNELVMLDGNPEYWGAPPAMKRIMMRHLPESQSQRLLLENGDLDVAYSLGASDLKGLEGNEDVTITTATGNGLYYLAMSQNDEVLTDPKVRQAIIQLLDYDGLNEAVLQYYGQTHLTPVQIGLGGEDFGLEIPRDVEGAKALLAEAGYADGLDLTMRALSVPPFDSLAQAIQGQLADGGIRAEIITGGGEVVYGAMRAREFQLLVGRSGGQVSHPDGDMRSIIFNPDNSTEANLTGILGWRIGYQDTDLNARIEEALLISDPEAQTAAYNEIQQLYHDRVPALQPISQVTDTVATRADVEGLVISPVWQTRLSTVTKSR